MRRTVMVNDTDLIVAEAVHAIFVEKKFGVLNEEVADLWFGIIEHKPARMALVCEIEGVVVPARLGLPIEEVETLVSEFPSGMVIDHVENHGQPMKVCEIRQRLQLVHFPMQLIGSVASRSFCIKELVHLSDVPREVGIGHGKIHFRGKVVGAVVSETETGLKFLNGQKLQGRHAQLCQVRELAGHVQKSPALVGYVRREERADMKLVDDELLEGRRNEPAGMPGEI